MVTARSARIMPSVVERSSANTFVSRLRRSRISAPLRVGKRALWSAARAVDQFRGVDALLLRANRIVRKTPVRVSVIVPTLGRPTLQRTVDSATWADEIIVVYDAPTPPSDHVVGENVSVHAIGPTGTWGAEQRQLGISKATGTHIAFMDDDDVYAPGVGRTIRDALSARPHRVHIFRMLDGETAYGGYGCVVVGAISTQMFIVPNDGQIGVWSKRYAGDFDFISSTLALRGGRPRFHDTVIALLRPKESQPTSSGEPVDPILQA